MNNGANATGVVKKKDNKEMTVIADLYISQVEHRRRRS